MSDEPQVPSDVAERWLGIVYVASRQKSISLLLTPKTRECIAAVQGVLEGLRAESAQMLDLLDSAMREIAHYPGDPLEGDGVWWDTMSLSTACEIGDMLVTLDLWEKQEGGHGRRQFYRPVKKPPSDSLQPLME